MKHSTQGSYPPRRSAGANPAVNGDLTAEIGMVRRLIQESYAAAAGSDDPKQLLAALDTLSKACARLVNLLKAQRDLGGGDELLQDLHLALADVQAEWAKERDQGG